MKRVVAAAAATLALLGACSTAAPAPTTVAASSSLERAFTQLVDENPMAPNTVEFRFSDSEADMDALEGADVYATADEAAMAKAQDGGVTASDPVPFATDRLVIAVAPGNPAGIGSPVDLARPDLRVTLAEPESALGRYTYAALRAAQVREPSAASREATSVAVVDKVRSGDADVGVVYASDAAAAGDQVEVVELPPEYQVEIVYVIAPLNASQAAVAFMTLVAGPTGRAMLERNGFGLP